VQPVITTKM